jgi:hypothetical protein
VSAESGPQSRAMRTGAAAAHAYAEYNCAGVTFEDRSEVLAAVRSGGIAGYEDASSKLDPTNERDGQGWGRWTRCR